MMDRTDRHCRYFLRLLAPDVRLYTEMVTATAVVHGDTGRLLAFDPAEHPLAVQLGGGDPALLARAARIAAGLGYHEVNLNVGCPSSRVAEGAFGACLMKDPGRVAECVGAMAAATDVPVTVKTRIGVDDCDDYDYLARFVERVAGAGCRVFLVHARKALLGGLSPKENRTIPPLRYEVVYRLKDDFAGLTIVINGGIDDAGAAASHLQRVDGVMIGRAAYSDPCLLTRLQATCLDDPEARSSQVPDREGIVRALFAYARHQIADGSRLHHLTRHILGLYHGEPGARAWRRYLSEAAASRDAGPEVLLESLGRLADGPDRPPAGRSGIHLLQSEQGA